MSLNAQKTREFSPNVLRRIKLRTRLFVTFLIISLVPVITIGIFSYHAYTQSMNEKVKQAALQSIELLNNNMSTQLGIYSDYIGSISVSDTVQNGVASVNNGHPLTGDIVNGIGEMIVTIPFQSTHLKNIRVVSNDRTVIYDLGYDDITPQRFNELLDNIEAASPQDSLQYIHTYRANDKIVIGRKIYDIHHISTPLGYIMLYMYNLLLVDDEPLIKVAFQSAVEWGKNGFLLAATASNGQEALHIVETQHIDAVITDLKMPGMDGLALIHELKKRSFTGPILVLSNYSDFDSVRTALTDGAYDYFLKINMNGESIGEHLEKMADLLRVQQQRQTEEDHRSFAIEAQKKENALIHCAQWITSTAGSSPASNPFSMLPEPLVFPVRLFTVTLIPAKTHPMPALDAVTDLITEVFDEIGGKVFLHTHENEICGLISNESLVASGRTLDKKLARLQRQVTTYFLDAPVIIYHDKPISLAELRQDYQLCEDSKALAFYVGRSAPIKATAHTVTAQPFHVSQAELSKATAVAAQNADELQMQIAVHTFFQNCAALCMPPQRVREACHLLLERPGENMIPQETLEQTFKEIEKAPTAEALEQLLCLILQERMGLSKIALSKFKKEVQAVIIYVNAHYMDKLTLDGIADYVGLNREYLSRLFSKETGTGLFQYINEVRMKRAGEMIRSNKQVYIKEVAAAVGFDDPYFFSRKFKEFYGKTPSEYAEA